MSKYIVTGGAGFIGSALVRTLLREGADKVHVIDNLSSGKEANLVEVASQVVLHRADIRRYDEIAPLLTDADTVFHLAAIPSVPRSIREPVPSHETNIDGTFNVFRACAEAKARRVVYAASSSAYGDTEVLPKVEDDASESEVPLCGAEVDGRVLRRRVPLLLRTRDRFAALLQRLWTRARIRRVLIPACCRYSCAR